MCSVDVIRGESFEAEQEKTYLFLGSSTQRPEQEKTKQGDMNGG